MFHGLIVHPVGFIQCKYIVLYNKSIYSGFYATKFQFNIIDVVRSDSRGQMVMDSLQTGSVRKNVRLRVFFVQILGRFFNESIRPQLM